MRKPLPYMVPIDEKETYMDIDRIYGDMIDGRCDDNLDMLRHFAEAGNDVANFYVGIAYQFGICTEIDFYSAKEYLKTSALAGVGEAHYQMGRIYIDEKEYGLASVELRAASRLGVPVSDFWLYHALLLTRDFAIDEVRDAIGRSIDQGNVSAMADYGALLLNGTLGRREIIKGIFYKLKSVVSYIKLVKENKTIEDQLH